MRNWGVVPGGGPAPLSAPSHQCSYGQQQGSPLVPPRGLSLVALRSGSPLIPEGGDWPSDLWPGCILAFEVPLPTEEAFKVFCHLLALQPSLVSFSEPEKTESLPPHSTTSSRLRLRFK